MATMNRPEPSRLMNARRVRSDHCSRGLITLADRVRSA